MHIALKYVNRNGRAYFLQTKPDKKGISRFSLSLKPTGEPATELPAGFEIWESPENAQVFVRRCLPSAIRPGEKKILEDAIVRETGGMLFIVDVEADSLVVYTNDAELDNDANRPLSRENKEMASQDWPGFVNSGRYQKMMKFTLTDGKKRIFRVERWCFLGRIDGWFYLDGGRSLKLLAEKYTGHLNKESFFELCRWR